MQKGNTRKVIRKTVALLMTLAMMLGSQVTVFANEGQVTGPVNVLNVDTSLNVNPPIPGHEAAEEENADPEIVFVYIEPEWMYMPLAVELEVVNGFNAIRRTYALPPDVNPRVISTEPIEMFGQTFSFAHISQQSTANETFKDLRYEVEIETGTNNMADILALLDQELRYDRDGFAGTLSLDIHSLRTQPAGTARQTSTITRQRSFPHLSSPDNAFIPRTIVDGGRTFYLASVDWASHAGGTAIDGQQTASTFTATATFSTQVTQTRNTGYVTVAEYVGTVFRTTPGYTIFTAIFYGEPVVEIWLNAPVVEESTSANATVAAVDVDAYVQEAGVASNSVVASNAPVAQTGEGNEANSNGFPLTTLLIVLGALAGLAAAGAGGFFLCKHLFGYNVTIYSHHSPREIIKAGKIKLDLNQSEPTIVLDNVVSKDPARTGVYSIQIAMRAVARIIGKTVRVVLLDKEALHTIPADALSRGTDYYEFDVSFADDDDDGTV